MRARALWLCAHCVHCDVAGLLLLVGSVLCVWRCAGVRRARAVRVCVLRSRVRLRVLRARRFFSRTKIRPISIHLAVHIRFV